MKAFLREVVGTLILAIVVFFLLQAAIAIPPSVVSSSSMKPTLQIGQRLIISKIAYAFHEPERGDIITFTPPFKSAGPFIKRIIGLPGESVELREGTAYIHKEDGTVLSLDEPYTKKWASGSPFKGNTIPENEYFVMGDNRNNSDDSRGGWTLPRQNIIGKAWLSIWPPGEWGLAPNYSLPD